MISVSLGSFSVVVKLKMEYKKRLGDYIGYESGQMGSLLPVFSTKGRRPLRTYCAILLYEYLWQTFSVSSIFVHVLLVRNTLQGPGLYERLFGEVIGMK